MIKIFCWLLCLLTVFCPSPTKAEDAAKVLCKQMEMTLNKGTQTNDKKARDAFLLYTQGFLETYGSIDEPDILTGLSKLIQSYEKFSDEDKFLSVSKIRPLICIKGKTTPSSNIPSFTEREIERNWLSSSFLDDISAYALQLEERAETSSRAAYFTGLSYLLGRGNICDVAKAKSWFENASHELNSAQDMLSQIELLEKENPQKKCLRTAFLNILLTPRLWPDFLQARPDFPD